MKTARTSDLLYVFVAMSSLTLGCGDEPSPLNQTKDPSQVGDGDASSDEEQEGDGDSSDDEVTPGDGDQSEGSGDDHPPESGDGDGNNQGDGDTQGDGDNQRDGDGPVVGDGDTQGDGDAQDDQDAGVGGDGDDPAFDVSAAKAVLLRSCGTCHKYGHPKFSIIGQGNMLDMDAVKQRAEAMADALYNALEPMPPYGTGGQLSITSEERENLHAYLLSLRDQP